MSSALETSIQPKNEASVFESAYDVASPAGRLEKLLFSKHMADVIFQVGPTKERIHAHQFVLMLASEVFYAQFNGSPGADSRQNYSEFPVVIPDIDSSAFREMLSYIYCEKVSLSSLNVIDLLYASQKYMLRTLKSRCEVFLKTLIKEENALQMLDRNRKHALRQVDDLCLDIILDNPNKFFGSNFLSLSEETVQLLADCKAMNCEEEQLRVAIEVWKVNNNKSTAFQIMLRSVRCRKLHSFGSPYYDREIKTILQINASRRIHLYGLGVFIGERPMMRSRLSGEVPVAYVTATVHLTNGSYYMKEVPLKKDLYVEEFMFQKFRVTNGHTLKVSIARKKRFSNGELFCLNDFVQIDSSSTIAVNCVPRKGPTESYTTNAVAYLLYDVED